MLAVTDYDEFGLFHENIAEFDLDVAELPPVARIETPVGDGASRRSVSALQWGSDDPEIVYLHGGAQNAHTWDTVALALGRPALAVDLPGHGHSDWRADGAYSPMNLADDVATVVGAHAPRARVVVGMSLGGLTAMELTVRHPALVRSLVMVDITPGVNAAKTKAITDFVDGPQEFASFDDLLARTIEHNPTRSESSLRRGILHNAHPQPDGSWQWRYDRGSHARARQTATDTSAAGATTTTDDGTADALVAAVGPLRVDCVPDHARARFAVAGGRRRRRRGGPATPAGTRRPRRRRCRSQRAGRPPGRAGRDPRRPPLTGHPSRLCAGFG